MTTIAKLSVSLSARVGKFEKGFKKANRTLKRFSRNVDRSTAGLRRIGTIATGAAVAGIGVLVKKQFAAIDSTAKLSRTIGLNTKELTGYQHAIQIAGGDQEGFNKSVIRMNRSIADAQAGLSTAIREFDRVGISVEELANLSTDERIKLLADRYNSIGDAAGRSSFLMNLFGRQGAAVGNLFEQGAEGINALQQEAEELGLTFDAVESTKIEQANDAITRMTAIITGASRVLAIQLAPFVTAAADKLKNMSKEGGGMGRVVFNAFNNILRIVGKLADWFELLKSVWFGFQGVIQTGSAVILNTINGIGDHIAKVINLIPGMSIEFKSFTQDLEKSFTEAAAKSSDERQKAFDKFYSGENSSKANMFFEDVAKKADEAAKNINKSIGFDELSQEGTEESSRTSFARGVNTDKLVIGKDAPQNKLVSIQRESNGLLKQIVENTSNQFAVVS